MILIATVGQLFCGAAGLTSASRTWYAFSRDRGDAGLEHLPPRQPRPGAVQRRDRGLGLLARDRDPGAVRQERLSRSRSSRSPASAPSASTWPTSSRSTCGCGRGTTSSRGLEPRPPLQARQHPCDRLRGPCVFSLNLPYTPAGLPWNDGFDTSLVNYTPLAIVIPLIFGVWYLISAKDSYQGPVRTLEEDEVTRD